MAIEVAAVLGTRVRGSHLGQRSRASATKGRTYERKRSDQNTAQSPCEEGVVHTWHLDEVYVKINGEMHYLWRAVDHEGEVLESYVTKTRDKAAALAFIRKALKRHGRPRTVVTDGLRSHGAALKAIGNADCKEVGRWLNNRAENSHQPFRRRERAMERFRRMKTLQKFAAVHGTVHNHFNQERHLISRDLYRERRSAALAEWRAVMGLGQAGGWGTTSARRQVAVRLTAPLGEIG